MVLSKATEYAIRALVYIKLKQGTGHIGFREVAAEIGAPEPFTAKILQNLVRKGVLNSLKGPGGGFFLDSQDDIPLTSVIQAMEGREIFNKCGFGLKGCSPANPCPIHNEYSLLRDQYKKLVSSATVASLAEKIRSGNAVINRLNVS